MTCAEFEEILHDLDRPGTPGLGMREEALAHAESCEHCALLMIEAESLDYGLHQLTLEDAEKQASRSVEAAVLAGFRKQRHTGTRQRVNWQVAALATAAVLLLALGISLRHRFEAPATATPGQPNAIQASPLGDSTASNAESALTRQIDENANSEADDENATAFVPLPFADDPDAIDNGLVVRVVMTRSALASLGMPALEAGGSDEIPADLMLSDDGTPQAIRLVSQAEID